MSRFGYLVTTCVMALAIGDFSLFHHTPRLLWNGSASTPVGLYSLHPVGQLRVGDLVADRPPPALSQLMAERHYLPQNVPLLKYVGALPGQTVCRHHLQVSVDGLVMARARARDSAHRHLPVWRGCHTLKCNEIFLLNPAAPDSFDGRYFGMVPRESVMAMPKRCGLRARSEAAQRVPPCSWAGLASAWDWRGACRARSAQSSGAEQCDGRPSDCRSVSSIRNSTKLGTRRYAGGKRRQCAGGVA